jgi:hypothetical protein
MAPIGIHIDPVGVSAVVVVAVMISRAMIICLL